MNWSQKRNKIEKEFDEFMGKKLSKQDIAVRIGLLDKLINKHSLLNASRVDLILIYRAYSKLDYWYSKIATEEQKAYSVEVFEK